MLDSGTETVLWSAGSATSLYSLRGAPRAARGGVGVARCGKCESPRAGDGALAGRLQVKPSSSHSLVRRVRFSLPASLAFSVQNGSVWFKCRNN